MGVVDLLAFSASLDSLLVELTICSDNSFFLPSVFSCIYLKLLNMISFNNVFTPVWKSYLTNSFSKAELTLRELCL